MATILGGDLKGKQTSGEETRMSENLKGKKVAFLTANEGVEQVELTGPLEALRGAGARSSKMSKEDSKHAVAGAG